MGVLKVVKIPRMKAKWLLYVVGFTLSVGGTDLNTQPITWYLLTSFAFEMDEDDYGRIVILSAVIILIILLILVGLLLFMLIWCKAFNLYWERVEKRSPKPRATKNVIAFIGQEYGVKLSNNEGVILTLIMCGKDTSGQLKVRTGMSPWHINYVINQLREHNLVEADRIAPIPSLGFLAKNDDVCGDLRPQYDPGT